MIVLIRKEQPPMGLDSSKDQSQCRLLCLPAELRNTIWELLLVQNTQSTPGTLPAHLSPDAPENARRKTRFCANVLRTCKQINLEGTPVLYGENVFEAHSSLLASLPSFLLLKQPNRVRLSQVICPRVAKLIRRFYIYVRLDTDPRFSKRQVEEAFLDVEALEIEVFQAMFGSCDFSVLKLFEGVRGVGKVTIHGSLGDGKYANWLASCMEMPAGTSVTPYYEEYVGGNKAWHAWAQGNR